MGLMGVGTIGLGDGGVAAHHLHVGVAQQFLPGDPLAAVVKMPVVNRPRRW